MAKEKGVKFSINPAAHSIECLEDTFLGVGIARKEWLTKKEVVNTMSLKEIEKGTSKNSNVWFDYAHHVPLLPNWDTLSLLASLKLPRSGSKGHSK